MELKNIGIDFPHKKGEFSQKIKNSHYTLCCFSTPFVYLYEGKMLEGEAGDILLNTPNSIVFHGPRENSNNGFVNDWLHIDGEDFSQLINKYPIPLNVSFNVGESYFLRKFFKKLMSEYISKNIGYNDIIDATVTDMIIKTHRTYQKLNSVDETFENIAIVKHSIIKNPSKNWTVNELTKLSGYSISRFCELYKKIYHISPMNDVINQRITLAKRLLESGQASVSYVAQTCGYNTINYFSKQFKEHTGYSPSDYTKFHIVD